MSADPKGRPRDAWSINPDAQPGGDPPTAYADLGRWLVRSISAGKTRVRDVESAGREIGRELAAEGPASTAERIRDVLGALGFQPTSKIDREGTLTYTLANCPYRDAVRENQTVVCALHRGLTRGLLDEMSPRTKLAGFVPKDPYAAGCLIQLKGPLADDAAHGSLASAAPRPAARGERADEGRRTARGALCSMRRQHRVPRFPNRSLTETRHAAGLDDAGPGGQHERRASTTATLPTCSAPREKCTSGEQRTPSARPPTTRPGPERAEERHLSRHRSWRRTTRVTTAIVTNPPTHTLTARWRQEHHDLIL